MLLASTPQVLGLQVHTTANDELKCLRGRENSCPTENQTADIQVTSTGLQLNPEELQLKLFQSGLHALDSLWMSPKSQYTNSHFPFKLLLPYTAGLRGGSLERSSQISFCLHVALPLNHPKTQPPSTFFTKETAWPPESIWVFRWFYIIFKCSKILMRSYEILNRKPCGQVRNQPTSFDMMPYSSHRYNQLRSEKLSQWLYMYLFTYFLTYCCRNFHGTHFLLDHASWTLESFRGLANYLPVSSFYVDSLSSHEHRRVLYYAQWSHSVELIPDYQAWHLTQSACSRPDVSLAPTALSQSSFPVPS